MASKVRERNVHREVQINIQNCYFITKISITYLGRITKNSELFLPLIIIIFWGLHLSIYIL